LRDYDPEKDKRFSGAVRLPHTPHPRVSIGVIGNLNHCGTYFLPNSSKLLD